MSVIVEDAVDRYVEKREAYLVATEQKHCEQLAPESANVHDMFFCGLTEE